MRNNCSSDLEKLLKFEAEGQKFAKNVRSLEQFIQTVRGLSLLIFDNLEQLKFKLEKNIGI